jgi:hypothetical protein
VKQPVALDAAVSSALAQAMAAVEADDPGFGACLAILADLLDGSGITGTLGVVEPLAQLFGLLRKLRPCAIWVEGPPATALALRELCTLDGVVIRGDLPAEPVPLLRGREAYWCVPADRDPGTLLGLPAGFGVVAAGRPDRAWVVAARKALRGRSLGVLVGPAAAAALEGAGLDLLIVDGGDGRVLAELAGSAPRLMWRPAEPVAAAPGAVLAQAGWAMTAALRIAGHRARGSHH